MSTPSNPDTRPAGSDLADTGNAKAKTPVMPFSIEMSEIEIGKRFIAASSSKITAWPEVAVHVPAVGIPGKREMLVALLREFARRTAQENRRNLQAAHSQLRTINSIAREMLVATRGPTGRTTAGKKQATAYAVS